MMQATFPHLAGWRSIRFWPEGMALDPQKSISGVDTIVPTMRGHWRASGSLVIHGEARVLQWQSFLAQMQGVLGTTLVPCFSWFRPKDRDGHVVAFNRIAGIAGAQTWEHFGFEGTPVSRIVVASVAPLRATEMDIEIRNSTGIRPGQYFSVGERLHQVLSHWKPDATSHRIMFHPPLRAQVTPGTPIKVDRPVCRMRFTSETEGQFDQSHDNPAPQITVNFVEAL